MKKIITKFIAVLTILVTVGSSTLMSTSVSAATEIPAKAALAVDVETGKILFNQNGKEVLPIASMTKILSLYLIRQAIANKKLSFDDQIKVTQDISKLSKDPDLSNVPITTGQVYSVRDLYESGWIYSSNAAVMLLADKLAGSQAKFVQMMQKQLKEWGIKDAQIVNASGLNNSNLTSKLRVPGTDAKAENKMSAEDLAMVTRHVLREFSDTLDITKTTEKTFAAGKKDEFKMTSFNRMLPGQPDAFADLKVDGLKTGTTDAAGESFTGTINSQGFRIITVVMHANGDKDDLGKRFKATAMLMRDVYKNWSPKVLYQKGDTNLVKPVKLKYGKEKSVKLATKDKTIIWNHQGQEVKTKIEVNPSAKNASETKKGQVFGAIKLADDGLGYLPDASGDVDLVATKSVAKKNIFARMFQGIGEFFGNLF